MFFFLIDAPDPFPTEMSPVLSCCATYIPCGFSVSSAEWSCSQSLCSSLPLWNTWNVATNPECILLPRLAIKNWQAFSLCRPQQVLTKDSVTVSVDAVVYYRVSNATVSVANVENAHHSTRLLAQTTLRNVLGTKNLSEILSERESISNSMQVSVYNSERPIKSYEIILPIEVMNFEFKFLAVNWSFKTKNEERKLTTMSLRLTGK